ncbi:MAG TPA: CPBP family intramembrane glutamic endopeptidase [bacterium]|jgi:membrane protease YdiL (CAAX protease family)|nr:CPBP family intramembrane glutamic endopeptidase [bacterium]
MPRPQRLPPTARRVFLLCLLALAAEGAYHFFFAQLLPSTADFNLLPQDLAVGLGSLACALFFYWLARLRYSGKALRRLPGAWGASCAVVLGLCAAAACLQWRRPAADFDLAHLPLRAAGFVSALCVAACEEIGFRGALTLAVREWAGKAGTVWALVLGSLGFALLHGGYQSLWNIPFAAAAGLALGVARLRGASLFSLVLAHGLMDGVDALWLSPSLTLGYWPALRATVLALLTVLALFFLPRADDELPPPALKKA